MQSLVVSAVFDESRNNNGMSESSIWFEIQCENPDGDMVDFATSNKSQFDLFMDGKGVTFHPYKTEKNLLHIELASAQGIKDEDSFDDIFMELEEMFCELLVTAGYRIHVVSRHNMEKYDGSSTNVFGFSTSTSKSTLLN
jgi:hypothetical protein